jgi:hypothetical protein
LPLLLVARWAAKGASPGPADGSHFPAAPASAEEAIAAIGLEEAHLCARTGRWGMYQWLDRAPKGRNENGIWWRRHDEYDLR